MNLPLSSKGERTRQAILQAAVALFTAQGYSATSMRQIADQAGIALGGIYNHFAGKDEIFQTAIIDRHPYARVLSLLEQVPGDDAETFVRNAVRITMAELGHQPEFIKLMMVELVEFNGAHFPAVVNTILPNALPMITRLQAMLGTDLPAPLLIRTLIGMILSYFLTEVLLSGGTVPESMRTGALDAFLNIYLHGILRSPRPHPADSPLEG